MNLEYAWNWNLVYLTTVEPILADGQNSWFSEIETRKPWFYKSKPRYVVLRYL